jgi:hypothetical protein
MQFNSVSYCLWLCLGDRNVFIADVTLFAGFEVYAAVFMKGSFFRDVTTS